MKYKILLIMRTSTFHTINVNYMVALDAASRTSRSLNDGELRLRRTHDVERVS